MPPFKSLLCMLGMLCAASLAAAEDFPYTAYIAADEAEIVAGPGHRFYATDRLPRGTKVEIYREEPSGWLAIRPPDGSFSWIPAENVERLEDGTGRVKQPIGAWVGTSVEQVAEHHPQITLKAGELVEILAEKSTASSSGKPRTWLKITPPSGEFRWVHLRDVVRHKPKDPPPPLADLVKQDDSNKHEGKPEDDSSQPQVTDPQQRAPRSDERVEPAQYRSTTTSNEPRAASPDGFVPRKRRDGDTSVSQASPSTTTGTRPSLEPGARFAAANARAPSAAPSAATSIRGGLSNDEIARQLDAIEVDLSLMVAKDRSQWDLPAIRRRVEALVESGADPASRGRARLVLDKVKQFEDVFDARSGSAPSGTAAKQDKSTGASSSLADPRYDAQGWLKPVVSKKSDKPIAPYAVVDSEGQPICFISPSPGLNLNRYLNKQVGLYGRRGYLEELKKPHVVAERVIELDNRLR